MTEQTHITQCDDPSYLPFARKCIKVLRATGLRYASQQYDVGGVSVKVRIEGEHSFISLSGGKFPLAMESGIINVGAVVTVGYHSERYWSGKRKFIPPYEATFTKQIGTTPWYLNPATSSAGQLAGIISVGSHITGKTRKDDVTDAFAQQTTGTDENGDRVANEEDNTLLAKKRAGVYCPASMFTGRARLYVQAMYGQPLYDRKEGDAEDVAIPTPTAIIRNGWPYLSLVAYTDPNTTRRKAFKDKVDADRAAHEESGSVLPFDDPYIVALTTNSGVYFDPVSRKHWLINPGYGYVTIYPLKASVAGEASRKWLKAGKLVGDEFKRMEAYVLSTCKPHVEVAETLTITEIIPWASGYGWHWNWSGTKADMVRVVSDGSGSGAAISTHYQLTATAVWNPEEKTTTWGASASTVSGPHRLTMSTPSCCVTHPNWTNRYTGENTEAMPVFWSEKIMLNYDPMIGGPYVSSDGPLYAFYRGDDLQVVEFSCNVLPPGTPSVTFTEHYAEMVPGGGPIDFNILGLTWGDASASLEVDYGLTAGVAFGIRCAGNIVGVQGGGDENGYSLVESGKTPVTTLPPVDENLVYFGPVAVRLKRGRVKEDGTYDYDEYYPGPDGGTGYLALGATGTLSQVIINTENHYTTHFGTAGGVIPFYDAEAFYLFQDTWRESVKNVRHRKVVEGYWQYHDAGKILHSIPGGYRVQYYGWSTYNILTTPSFTMSQSTEPDETTIDTEVSFLVSVSSSGIQFIDGKPPSSTYMLFADGDADYVVETFNTISSAGTEDIFRGLTELNWPDMPGMQNPVIVGWV